MTRAKSRETAMGIQDAFHVWSSHIQFSNETESLTGAMRHSSCSSFDRPCSHGHRTFLLSQIPCSIQLERQHILR
jgi:hypothetical protein